MPVTAGAGHGARSSPHLAAERVVCHGLPARICWFGLRERHRADVACNAMAAAAQLDAPILLECIRRAVVTGIQLGSSWVHLARRLARLARDCLSTHIRSPCTDNAVLDGLGRSGG